MLTPGPLRVRYPWPGARLYGLGQTASSTASAATNGTAPPLAAIDGFAHGFERGRDAGLPGGDDFPKILGRSTVLRLRLPLGLRRLLIRRLRRPARRLCFYFSCWPTREGGDVDDTRFGIDHLEQFLCAAGEPDWQSEDRCWRFGT